VPSTVVLLGRWNWWPSKLEIDRPDDDAVAGPGGTSVDDASVAPSELH
jgi:uncharacterized membrane protein YdfJ with MMPL/SSD domain